MTPEQRITQLENEMRLLKAGATFPFDVESAIRERLGATALFTSTKAASTEQQAVNEAGAASYGVMKTSDGFVQTTIGGTIIYIPYFT